MNDMELNTFKIWIIQQNWFMHMKFTNPPLQGRNTGELKGEIEIQIHPWMPQIADSRPPLESNATQAENN